MVTAFPLVQNGMSKGTGVYPPMQSRLVHCEEDASVTIQFNDGTESASYAMTLGEDRLLGSTVDSITVVSGVISLA